MAPARRRANRGWWALVGVLNAAGVAGLLIVSLLYWSSRPSGGAVAGAPLPAPLVLAHPSATPAPTRYYLPSVTPNPFATLVEDYSTPTAFVFTQGPLPAPIGASVLGRPIEAYTFGNGPAQYLIVAGIHGGYEGNTIDLANLLIVHLTQHPEVLPEGATLYIIPDLNPDAAARGRNADARVNANGVDLNRNFPTPNWVPNWDHTNCWNDRPTTGGAYPGSEPETQTVMAFIQAHHLLAMISYHSAALGVFPGGDPWTESSQRLAGLLGLVTHYPYPPINTGCVYTGTLADWAVEHGVGAAVDMELATHASPDFAQNLRALQVLVNFNP
jgi:hypothetical protein